MQIDKQNGDICFNESSHTYFDKTDPKKKFLSVTTLIHKFEPPFDKDFWSAYKAVEQLINPEYWRAARSELLSTKTCTPKLIESFEIPINDFNAVQQNILDGWQKENLASTQRGSSIHADLERSFYTQKTDISLAKYGLGGRFSCVEGKTELDLENGVYPEYLIHYESPDGKLRIAGQIDLLVKEGEAFSIVDWKGLALNTKIPTITGWTTMEDIKVGDKVFDMEGKQCAVIHKSEIHYNPCYKITLDGAEIIADTDHKWLVEFKKGDTAVLSTKALAEHLKAYPDEKIYIKSTEPLEGPIVEPIDYSKIKTPVDVKKLILRMLRAAFDQRALVFNYVSEYHGTVTPTCVILPKCEFSWEFQELAHTLGCHTSVDSKGNIKVLNADYWQIHSVEPVETVATQCIEVDSHTHTYLCTERMIPTHNTNKQIKKSSYFNKTTKQSEKLKYPLNDLDSCNYSVYNMQLSTYAWMVQQLHPEWACKELVLVHFDHENNMTTYKMDYLKDQVERMLNFWKKESVLEEHRANRKRIEY